MVALPRTAAVRTSRRLSRPELAGVAGGGAVAGAGLAALEGTTNPVAIVVLVLLAFAVAQTAVSFAVEGRRQAADRLMTTAAYVSLLIALTPLVAVTSYTVAKGVKRLDGSFFADTMRGIRPTSPAGGAHHAIVGTLEQVALAGAIAIPLGILTAVYVTEYGKGFFASAVRFTTDVMTGVPSIVAGLFVFAFFVLPPLNRGPSGLAAALALSILMLPVVMRSSEEMIKLVPNELREASYALGIPKWKTILKIVLPTASAGITTGVMLAVARVTGETAPLLLTSQLTNFGNSDPFSGKQMGLGAYVYTQAQSSATGAQDRAWAAALTLVAIVLALYVTARLLTRRNVLAR